ncbi:MAG: ABC transporter permease [Thermomicrobiales bacterium]
MVQEAKIGAAPRVTPVDDRESPEGREGAALQLGRVREQRSLWGNAWRQFRRHRLAMLGLVVLSILILVTVLGSPLYGRSTDTPFEYTPSMTPTFDNLFGTDSLGQDVLARILWGGRISLAVGLVAASVSILLGTGIGALAGFFGGFLDTLLMRLTDMFISLPQLPLLLLISFLFTDRIEGFFDERFGAGNVGIFVLIVTVIGILNWMPTARLVRASFLSMREKEFVEAARSVGATRSNLIFRHILPNVLSPIIVAATLGVGQAIITESSLSFLGLGFPSDVPTWGRMLFEAKDYIQLSPHESFIPGTMIFLTVLSINYIGDGLRDALDPRKTQ